MGGTCRAKEKEKKMQDIPTDRLRLKRQQQDGQWVLDWAFGVGGGGKGGVGRGRAKKKSQRFSMEERGRGGGLNMAEW